MKKYIFTDFDGVLNTERYHAACLTMGQMPSDAYGPLFDPEVVENLRSVVEATGAEIIISSSWKLEGEERMRTLWEIRKMPGVLVGCTPDAVMEMDILSLDLDNPDSFAQMAGRGNEIRQWLSENASGDDLYVIFDDMPDFLPEQKEFVVLTNPRVGITAEDAAKAIEILNR